VFDGEAGKLLAFEELRIYSTNGSLVLLIPDPPRQFDPLTR